MFTGGILDCLNDVGIQKRLPTSIGVYYLRVCSGFIHQFLVQLLIKEAGEALNGARTIGDTVLITSFKSSLDKLRQTLDLLIPPELEDLYVEGDDHDGNGK